MGAGGDGSSRAVQGGADPGRAWEAMIGGKAAAVDATANRNAIRRAALSVNGLFTAVLPHAPGARIICGAADPCTLGPAFTGFAATSVAGCDADPDRAYERCIGEAVEYLSQLSPEDDPLRQGRAVAATDLREGGATMLPAEICLRTLDGQDRRIGSGCAAGRSGTEATAAALWELIERDALVSWWYEGHAPRPLDKHVMHGADRYLQQLRGGAGVQRTVLLDISAYPGLPAVAACSFGADGRGFAGGFAAHADTLTAARKAIRELMQMELGLLFIAAKLSEGLTLNEEELRQQRRADEIAIDHPALAVNGAARDALIVDGPEGGLARGLAGMPGLVHAVDLTRPYFGIPVARVVAPALRSVRRDAPGVGLL